MHDMEDSSDIANLFQHFDGDPAGYQEFMLSSDALHAKSRWPLIAAIDPAAFAPPSSVIRERQDSTRAVDTASAIPTAMPFKAIAAIAEKPATKAQFVAPQANVLSAVRRGREPAALDMEAARAATHNALPEDTPAVVETSATPLPAAVPTPKRSRVKKPVLSTTHPDASVPAAPQPALTAQIANAEPETSVNEARFVAPKPKVLSAGPTRRGHKPAELNANTQGDASLTAPVAADPAVADEQNGHRAGNGTSRPHSTDTPPFLFKRL
jgi:hypothetical protein